MITDDKSSKWARAISLFTWVVAEAVFIAFLAWVFYVVLWVLEN